jgi:hypothetical protein
MNNTQGLKRTVEATTFDDAHAAYEDLCKAIRNAVPDETLVGKRLGELQIFMEGKAGKQLAQLFSFPRIDVNSVVVLDIHNPTTFRAELLDLGIPDPLDGLEDSEE